VTVNNYSYKTCLTLAFIILLGFIVRIVGVSFGLPFLYHNDEPIVVNYALAYGSGDFNPHFFNVPPLLSYFLFFEFSVYFVLGMISGVFGSLLDYQFFYLTDPSSFYLIGRISTGVIIGTFTIYLMYLVGKRFFSEGTGLISAFFLSLTFLHVRDSHCIYFDIPLTFFTLLTVYFMFKFMDTRKTKDLVLISITLGITTAIKYNGVLLIVPIAIVYFLPFLKKEVRLKEILFDKKLFIIPIISGLIFIVCNPFSIIDFKQFLRDMTSMPMYSPGILFHLKYSLMLGMGLPLLLLSLSGALYACFRLQSKLIVLSVFIVFFYAVLCHSSQRAERYVLPIVPLLLLSGAWFLREMSLKYKMFNSRKSLFLVVASILVILPSVVRVGYSDYLFLQKDSRTIAYEWIKNNIPCGTRIAVDVTSDAYPRLAQSRKQLAELKKYTERAVFKRPRGAVEKKLDLQLKNPFYPRETYELSFLKYNPGIGFTSTFPDMPFDWDKIRKRKIQYVVFGGSLQSPKFSIFCEEIKGNAELVKEVNPYKNKDRYHSTEVTAITGVHFVDSEIKEREMNGDVIKIFKVLY